MTDELTALRTALKDATAKKTFAKTRPQTKADKIRALEREIGAMRAEGARWQDVADVLKAAGLDVTEATIRAAVGKRRGGAVPTPFAAKRRRGNTAADAADAHATQTQTPTNTFGGAGREF